MLLNKDPSPFPRRFALLAQSSWKSHLDPFRPLDIRLDEETNSDLVYWILNTSFEPAFPPSSPSWLPELPVWHVCFQVPTKPRDPKPRLLLPSNLKGCEGLSLPSFFDLLTFLQS